HQIWSGEGLRFQVLCERGWHGRESAVTVAVIVSVPSCIGVKSDDERSRMPSTEQVGGIFYEKEREKDQKNIDFFLMVLV
ncbi:MAG: hypothetical protein IKX48_11365, partial [Victivallales bacterium]|nr:hypothetical protein [Victivallales bacterium]